MLQKILAGLILLVVVLTVLILMQPDDFHYERTMTMDAPPETIFPLVNNFHQWEGWSPWAKVDPDAKITYSGPDEGVGAAFAWDGNHDVGTGKMTIIESKPNELIRIQLEFVKPFEGTHTTEFTFVPQGDQTNVTWSMYGKNDFIGKAMGLFVDCEKMIGDMYEKGLSAIKSLAESRKEEKEEGGIIE